MSRDPPVHPDRPAPLESRVRRVRLAQSGCPGPRARSDRRANQVRRVPQGPRGQAGSLDYKVPRDWMDQAGPRGRRDFRERPGLREHLGLRDPRDSRDCRALQDLKANRGLRGNQDLPVNLALRGQAGSAT